jgi:hypothetical protein
VARIRSHLQSPATSLLRHRVSVRVQYLVLTGAKATLHDPDNLAEATTLLPRLLYHCCVRLPAWWHTPQPDATG